MICGSMITISSYFSLVCLVVYSMCKYAEASHIILQSENWKGNVSETCYVICKMLYVVYVVFQTETNVGFVKFRK